MTFDWGLASVLLVLIMHLASFVWWASKTNQRMEEAERDIRNLQTQFSKLPERLSALESAMDWIKQSLGRIETKLDSKADK